MAKNVFAFANQKGGVGKTTSCVNIAAGLAKLGKKVLLIDLDPQGNATMGSGVDKLSLEISSNEMLLEGVGSTEAVIEDTPAGYDLIPANSDLTQAEISLLGKEGAELILRRALESLRPVYDYILLDCPPSLNMLTLNSLSAADFVVIAAQCEYYALEGLSDLLNTISQLQESVNPELEVFGVIRTLVDSRSKLAMEVSKQIAKHFGKIAFKTSIPRNIRIAEAPSYGLPVILYDKKSAGAESYMKLAKEFIKRSSPEEAKKATKKKSKKTTKKSSKKASKKVSKKTSKKVKTEVKKSKKKVLKKATEKDKKKVTKAKKRTVKKVAKKSTVKKSTAKKSRARSRVAEEI